MKVFITLKDITELGGGEKVCVNLANALSQRGFKLVVISLYNSRGAPTYRPSEALEIIYLKPGAAGRSPISRLFYKSVYRIYLSLKICKLIAMHKPRVLLANDGLFLPLVKSKSTRYLRIWHMSAPKKPRLSLRLFDSLVLLSPKQLDTWRTYHDSLSVIPNFINEIPKLAPRPRQKRRLLSIGSMGRGDIKGFFRLVQIASLLQAGLRDGSNDLLSSWEWVLIGDGPLRGELENRIRALDLQGFLRIEGFREDIAAAYESSDIFCLTSHAEGFPMVLLEAMAFGLAAVSFDIASGPSDMIDDGKSGFLVEDGDIEGFACKLLELMKGPLRIEAMGAFGASEVRRRFSKEAILPLWENLLRG